MTLLAVDGTGLLVRCARASRHRYLATADGTPTATLTMFVGALARIIRLQRPSHVVIAWDGAEARRWRQQLYPPYKADRAAKEHPGADLRRAMQFCEAAGLQQIQLPGFEADDILAAVVRGAESRMPDRPLLLCSDDKDLQQLLTEDRQVTMASLNLSVKTDAAGVEGMWGLPPAWLPKLRALCGDPSDNIPGLPGVGPKRALAMIRAGEENWPLPTWVLRDRDKRGLVAAWHSVMELADPFRPPEPEAELGLFTDLDVSAAWSPESAVKVPELLDRYGMYGLADRLGKGGFW